MYCSKCGVKNNDKANFCAGCGESVNPTKNGVKSILIAGIIFFLIALGGVGYGFKELVFTEKEVVGEVEGESPPIETTTASPVTAKAKAKVKEKETETEKVKEKEKDKTQVIQETMPKVFTILTEEGQGSGFLYGNGGHIVTNAHVVAGYTNVIIRNSAGKEAEAQVIGISDRSDVALLLSKEYAQVKPLITEAEDSIIGTEVIALGSPQGFENSASIGYLTGINRDMELGFVYEHLYQIDAQIDKGSSGGPLIDAKTGKVIGINSLIYKENNLFGFSIPMNSVAGLVDSWISNPMSGQQVASLFGVYEEYTYSEENVSDETYEDDYTEDEWNYFTFETDSLANFIISFREYYEMALDAEDFYWISDMLQPDSIAYNDLEIYIQDIAGQGMTFDFTSNTITGVEMYDDYALVSTNEEFDFINAAGEYMYYNRNKVYTVIIDSSGYYQIKNIEIYD
ncbi:Trypsin-like peptidase domain-containing protein [Psychrobacillus sp. OK028]|uniref:S1C family serine protease n=1 Tax=Psychrobacillus sp. OK028 TaxID=1884359 RepID=UPI000884783F|nr:trypsin-like peptidase domain-containing protein [Psychrobacillus sp. OK028]SDN60267.1 Trypsin-like peptidase domain-containing protein [Psychrobacillus sp. OK028]